MKAEYLSANHFEETGGGRCSLYRKSAPANRSRRNARDLTARPFEFHVGLVEGPHTLNQEKLYINLGLCTAIFFLKVGSNNGERVEQRKNL